MSKINWKFYPANNQPPDFIVELVKVFAENHDKIASTKFDHDSNTVLHYISQSLIDIGFLVEKGKKKDDKICIPVLFGLNGKIEKKFDADAYNESKKIVLEVEAGRGVLNNQFLKDYFQACMMLNVEYFAVAVRNNYKNRDDFSEVIRFFDSLYASGRIITKLKGVLIIGY